MEFHLRSLTSTHHQVVEANYHLTELRPVMEGDSIKNCPKPFRWDSPRARIDCHYLSAHTGRYVTNSQLRMGSYYVAAALSSPTHFGRLCCNASTLAIKVWRGARGAGIFLSNFQAGAFEILDLFVFKQILDLLKKIVDLSVCRRVQVS